MKIEWTLEAKNNLCEIEDYLFDVFGYQTVEGFYTLVDKALEILSAGNIDFERYENTDLRKYLLTEYNYMIYKRLEDKIVVIAVINNHRSPKDNYQKITELKKSN